MAVDTLKLYERFRKTDLSEAASREIAEVLKENIEESQGGFATKGNVDDTVNLAVEKLRKEMAEMKYDIIKWLVGLLLFQTLVLFFAKIFIP